MTESATLQNVEVNLDDFSGIDGGNILTPPQAKIFDRSESAFEKFAEAIQNGKTPEEKSLEDNPKDLPPVEEKKFEVPTDLNEQLANPDQIIEEEKEKASRAKTDKSSTVDYIKSKIEAKDFVAFDDYDEKVPISEYLENLPNKDLHALIDENIKLKEEKLKEETPKQFFDSLPYELQVAADYWINKGGRDLKSLFSALGKVEEIRDLDIDKESDQEKIVEEYLRNANSDWTPEEVQEQLTEWKDLGQIEKKAKQLKPKLDRMKEQIVEYQLAEQEQRAQLQTQRAQAYVKNVYDALKPGEIGGIKLDSKTQTSLYNGLVRADYSSIGGGNTNLLGHLLEKYQYQEPDYGRISEVLWLLSDPDGFKNSLIKKGANIKTEEIVRKLKTEQGNRSSSTAFEDPTTNTSRVKGAIPKPGKDIFKR